MAHCQADLLILMVDILTSCFFSLAFVLQCLGKNKKFHIYNKFIHIFPQSLSHRHYQDFLKGGRQKGREAQTTLRGEGVVVAGSLLGQIL